ncbi:hypothetical protein K1F50_20415 [Muricauda oceani]|nr:hypothetical protein [Allomuricauda oceani]MBW8245180.1 hypothetical protein [Allomuricauda oceani]
MKTISKKRKKELREEYERINGLRYVRGLKKEPSVSWFEWVGYRDNQ